MIKCMPQVLTFAKICLNANLILHSLVKYFTLIFMFLEKNEANSIVYGITGPNPMQQIPVYTIRLYVGIDQLEKLKLVT